MSEKIDGGPAFPNTHVHHLYGEPGWKGREGMSLRDWFAGMVVQGLCSQDRLEYRQYGFEEKEIDWKELIAKRCYAIADAMLAEREKK